MSKRSRKGVARNPPAVEIPWDQITEEMKCQFCHQGRTMDILQSGKLYKLISGKNLASTEHSLLSSYRRINLLVSFLVVKQHQIQKLYKFDHCIH